MTASDPKDVFRWNHDSARHPGDPLFGPASGGASPEKIVEAFDALAASVVCHGGGRPRPTCDIHTLMDAIMARADFESQAARRYALYPWAAGRDFHAALARLNSKLAERWRRADVDVDNARDALYARQTGGLIRLGSRL